MNNKQPLTWEIPLLALFLSCMWGIGIYIAVWYHFPLMLFIYYAIVKWIYETLKDEKIELVWLTLFPLKYLLEWKHEHIMGVQEKSVLQPPQNTSKPGLWSGLFFIVLLWLALLMLFGLILPVGNPYVRQWFGISFFSILVLIPLHIFLAYKLRNKVYPCLVMSITGLAFSLVALIGLMVQSK